VHLKWNMTSITLVKLRGSFGEELI
jgi:hypothetical protein